MAIAQLIFKKGNFISTIELDIIISESATASVRVTENPVENGANINDHIIVEPLSFTTEGIVSNISSNALGQFGRLSTVLSKDMTRSKEAWRELLRIQAEKTKFTLVQGLHQYDNVVILNLTESQNKDTANGLFFTATMKEIILVGTEAIVEDQFNDSNIADKMVEATPGGQKQLKESTL